MTNLYEAGDINQTGGGAVDDDIDDVDDVDDLDDMDDVDDGNDVDDADDDEEVSARATSCGRSTGARRSPS